ncbi:hypothetical protein BV898_02808 [Hypsibius exemplaris]|uniref:G-protein coupled receptors family 1 profile domain-containing protein n=1 Tax=Hypsibius exemplaris TaxID=2072580 RepID=A0A1W0X7S5_HYPEX|nr:hypothetical protein BV898_02808 [Hypsibius exemplaris]
MNSSDFFLTKCNVTEHVDEQVLHPQHPVRFVEAVLYPVFFFLSTVGNTINLLVLMHNRPKTTSDLYMMAMAVSDIILIWLRFPGWLSKAAPELILTMGSGYATFFLVYDAMKEHICTTFGFFSIGILLVFSMERLLLVAKPMKFYGIIKPKKAKIAIPIIGCLSIILFAQIGVDSVVRLARGATSAEWVATRPGWLEICNQVQAIIQVR